MIFFFFSFSFASFVSLSLFFFLSIIGKDSSYFQLFELSQSEPTIPFSICIASMLSLLKHAKG